MRGARRWTGPRDVRIDAADELLGCRRRSVAPRLELQGQRGGRAPAGGLNLIVPANRRQQRPYRVSPRAGLQLLVPLVVLGAASVWYWRWSAAHGVENLNPYGAVQFGSALVILLMIILFPAPYTRSGDFLVAAILYGLAKVTEYFDQPIFAATGGIVSGHTLKHLLAALAVFWLARMLKLRERTNATDYVAPRPHP